MDIDVLRSIARSRVTRNLTPEECRKYLYATTSRPSREMPHAIQTYKL
jgi:hypothetical protein